VSQSPAKFPLVLIISNILGHKLGRTRLHGDEGERTLTGDGPVLDAPNNTQCNARTSKRSSQLILRTSYHPVDTTQRTTIHTPSARSCTDRHRWTLCIYWFNFQRKKTNTIVAGSLWRSERSSHPEYPTVASLSPRRHEWSVNPSSRHPNLPLPAMPLSERAAAGMAAAWLLSSSQHVAAGLV
jgi:hypothetical protein